MSDRSSVEEGSVQQRKISIEAKENRKGDNVIRYEPECPGTSNSRRKGVEQNYIRPQQSNHKGSFIFV